MSNRDVGRHAAGWPDEDGYLDAPELGGTEFGNAEYDGTPFDDAEFGDAAFEDAAFEDAAFEDAAFEDAEVDEDPDAAPYPLTWERGVFDRVERPGGEAPNAQWWRHGPLPDEPGGTAAERALAPEGAPPYDEPWITGERSGRRRWLLLAGVAVAGAAISTGAVLLASGHPGAATAAARSTSAGAARTAASPSASTSARPTAAPSSAGGGAGTGAPLTLAAAQRVLSAYTAQNNAANAARSASGLAMVETGGSYAIDASLYRLQAAAKAAPYPAFAPASATYYIPASEAAGGPRWFVVLVANAFATAPKKVTSTEYLLFTQSAPGARWRNAVEPYLLSGTAAPQVAIGRDGLATAVSLTDGALAVAPGQLAARTAGSMDGVGGGIYVTSVSPELVDRVNQKFWRGKLPGTRVHDAHAAAAAAGPVGQAFALRTTSGGALVFYTDSAELTFTPPAGSRVRLSVPGLYSPDQALARAGLAYLDQLAAYDPPAGHGAATVIASYSGITGKN